MGGGGRGVCWRALNNAMFSGMTLKGIMLGFSRIIYLTLAIWAKPPSHCLQSRVNCLSGQ